MRVLDLFSGIGAYALGMQRAGAETVAFCEINEYCRKILAKHWPNVPCYDDVTTLTAERLHADGIRPNWIVAGWPCQDISVAGSGSGLDGARSGLWEHIARLAGEIGAEGLLLENSSNLLAINGGRDFGRVLSDLATLGMHVEWHCLPAAAFDAPHIRDRLWIVATLADPARNGESGQSSTPRAERERTRARDQSVTVSNASRIRCNTRRPEPKRRADGSHSPAHAYSVAPIGAAISRQERVSWKPEPNVGRVVHGAPDRVDRIHALGNCNPPIIPETITRAILAAHPRRSPAQYEGE